MNANVMDSCGYGGASAKLKTTSPLSRGPSSHRRWTRHDEIGDGDSARLLEDMDAPEAWTLASFDDLVPREAV